MSEKAKRISITFNLDNPRHREQWEYLQARNNKVGLLRDGLELIMSDKTIAIDKPVKLNNSITEDELDNDCMNF